MYPNAEDWTSGLVLKVVVVVIVINAHRPSIVLKSGAQKGTLPPLTIVVVVVGIEPLNCTHDCSLLKFDS